MGLGNTSTEFGALAKTLHILGALYNHFILKNNIVRRMTVGVK